jgi:glycosyltransferase involved in cell wall biosynthesis
MRIGVNALYLLPGGVGGTEIYLRSLLEALARIDHENRYIVFTNLETTDLCPNAPNFETVQQKVRATSRPARLLWEQFRLPLRGLDVLCNPGFTAPLFPPCPQVTVFHDLQHKRHPEFFHRIDLPFWNFFLWGAVRRSARLIAVSEETRRDLVRFYGRSEIDVIPHGVDENLFKLERKPEALLLYVSTLHPHKNHERLLRVFARLRGERPEWRLVLAGMRGFAAAGIERAVSHLSLSDSVRITGWIPRTDLFDLYRRAGAFVYPSRFEGFGMPLLEALACGIPAACSDIEPLRSIAGSAAVHFDPDNEDSLLRALRAITAEGETRARLASAGPPQAAQFSWDDAARKTLASLTTAACAGR